MIIYSSKYQWSHYFGIIVNSNQSGISVLRETSSTKLIEYDNTIMLVVNDYNRYE